MALEAHIMPLPGSYAAVALPAGTDPATAVGNLAAVAGMVPRPDVLGNLQGVYRLDYTADGTLVLTLPAAVVKADALAAAAAPAPARPALLPSVAEKVATVLLTAPELTPTTRAALETALLGK